MYDWGRHIVYNVMMHNRTIVYIKTHGCANRFSFIFNECKLKEIAGVCLPVTTVFGNGSSDCFLIEYNVLLASVWIWDCGEFTAEKEKPILFDVWLVQLNRSQYNFYINQPTKWYQKDKNLWMLNNVYLRECPYTQLLYLRLF